MIVKFANILEFCCTRDSPFLVTGVMMSRAVFVKKKGEETKKFDEPQSIFLTQVHFLLFIFLSPLLFLCCQEFEIIFHTGTTVLVG